MIGLLNAEFVPVWINVRTTALPPQPWVRDVLVNARVDDANRIIDPFSEGFFLRSVVLAPDGGTVLNRQPTTVAGSLASIARNGDLAYAEVDGPGYLSMLRKALVQFGRTPPPLN